MTLRNSPHIVVVKLLLQTSIQLSYKSYNTQLHNLSYNMQLYYSHLITAITLSYRLFYCSYYSELYSYPITAILHSYTGIFWGLYSLQIITSITKFSCQNPFTTQLRKPKLDLTRKSCTYTQHHKLNDSKISQLLLTCFWPHSISRFIGSFSVTMMFVLATFLQETFVLP